MRWVFVVTLAACAAGDTQSFPREGCPADADRLVEEAWTLYRANEIKPALKLFERAQSWCPKHVGARVGLGYALLRRDRLADARQWFESVTAMDSLVTDAWMGVGLVAWRLDDHAAARVAFEQVLAQNPERGEALTYLNRLPPSLGTPPERPPLVLSDSSTYSVRAHRARFEIRTANGWQPFYVNGVNLGAALPGRHPSEFPDSSLYARWIAEMVEMRANAVRVYTIHPPWFYQALLEHNRRHPGTPLWLIHGVWAELPPEHMYDDPAWESEFFAEMHRVVDLLHGRADIEPQPGRAWGHYTADVSPWVLAYIIGREWEPFSVVAFNEARPSVTRWDGEFVRVRRGNAMEAWLGKACDDIIAYEMKKYRTQRPIAYTNWPTLDPLTHPTEMTIPAEVEHRKALGERVKRYPREYDNDSVGIDATRMEATNRFPAGVFAAFHAYPYYPDFMILDSAYSQARSSLGASNYFGYLTDLKRHHGDMPVIIAEYGVPASFGIAHLQPQGWHHGGHTEQAMADINARLTREIAEAGLAGGAIFAWIDEWFKKNWIVIEYELPLDRNRLWLNRLDAEQHYGMIAMEPGEILSGKTLTERLASWQDLPALYRSENGMRLKAATDEAYLWLLFEPAGQSVEELLVGFDIIKPKSGDFRWPGKVGEKLPVGIEFVLTAREREVRVLADRRSNPVWIDTVRAKVPATDIRVRAIDHGAPVGLFDGRVEQWFQDRYVTRKNSDGLYDSLRVVTNRPRFTRDGVEYAALGYDRGVLPNGPPPDGMWERLPDGTLEVRIPWMLLNFTDPSQRRVLQDGRRSERFGGDLGTLTVESIGIVASAQLADQTRHAFPATGREVAQFSWPTWETPTWKERRRPTFDVMRRVFERLARPDVADGSP